MDLTERQLSRETIYEGKILHIYRDDVLLPNGRTSVRGSPTTPAVSPSSLLTKTTTCSP